MIAEEKGFFKSEGLNVIVVIMQNQVVVNGVVTRNVDYGGTFSNFVGAAISGLPVRIVMSAMDGSDHYLVTSANVKRVEDLKGKTFGISSFGGTPHSEAVMILRKYGMSPEKDVTFLQIGGSSSRYAALESGSIHAAMLVPPFNNFAKKRGFNQILSFNEIMNIPLGGIAVHTQQMKEKPDEIVKMIKAVLKAIDYIRNRKAGYFIPPGSQVGHQGSRRAREHLPRHGRSVQQRRRGVRPNHEQRAAVGARHPQNQGRQNARGYRRLEFREKSPGGVEDPLGLSVVKTDCSSHRLVSTQSAGLPGVSILP